MRQERPIVLFCSSNERKPVINALETALKRECKARLWYRDAFPPGSFTLDAIENAIRYADFVVFVLAGEDIVRSRRRRQNAPRDNIVLEAGLSLSVLGRERTFLTYSQQEKPKIPTDLSGVTLIPYKPTPGGLQKAAHALRAAMKRIGPRDHLKESEIAVPYKSRAEVSVRFLGAAIDSVDSFGGDLSWLRTDLPGFGTLVRRGVRVRFLTSARKVPSIRRAKRLGIEFREYAKGDAPPVKGSIIDSDSERNSSALLVRKVKLASHARSLVSPFSYSMVAYHGPRDYGAIKTMAALFNKFWEAGRPL